MSQAIRQEIEDVPQRPRVLAKLRITRADGENFVAALDRTALRTTDVVEHWSYERDPADAKYVNLALAVHAKLVVTRDLDLLDLMADTNEAGLKLRHEFPGFAVLTPPAFLAEVERSRGQQDP